MTGYIAVDSETAARRVASKLERLTAFLSEHPQLGPSRSDIGPDLRILVSPPYLILYRTVPDVDDQPIQRVEIVAIVDVRRDLERLF